jgi:hypothetical protein
MPAYRQMLFAVGVMSVMMATSALAFQPLPMMLGGYPAPYRAEMTPSTRVMQSGNTNDIVVLQQGRHCRISGAREQRIERTTSNPCLAADSAPDGICFERLGNSVPINGSAMLELWDSRCGT